MSKFCFYCNKTDPLLLKLFTAYSVDLTIPDVYKCNFCHREAIRLDFQFIETELVPDETTRFV